MTVSPSTPPPFDTAQALRLARETFEIEAAALTGLAARVDERFAQAVQMVLATTGRLVVMGMGKSGHVGRKIAATLASTGTPAFFVHPAEASHGDLGMVTGADVVLAISNSGESGELTAILPVLKRLGAPLIALTGGLQSTLAKHADLVLDCSVEREACPLNLAPPPAPPPNWRWATLWPWPCSTPVASAPKTLPARTPAARWAASCSPMSATSCAVAIRCPA